MSDDLTILQAQLDLLNAQKTNVQDTSTRQIAQFNSQILMNEKQTVLNVARIDQQIALCQAQIGLLTTPQP